MAATTTLTDLLDNLPNSPNKQDSLIQIKALASQLPGRDLRETIPNISFDVIFECLDSDDIEQVTLTCGVLRDLLSGLDPSVLLPQFHDQLLMGLGHPAEPVKHLCLHECVRVAEASVQILTQHTTILSQVISLLGNDSLTVAKAAAFTLMTAGSSADGLEYLFRGEGLPCLLRLLEEKDIARFRIYELATDLSRASPAALSLCNSAGVIQKLINEVYRDDVLVQLNGLELLTRLSTVTHGALFLETQGVTERLDTMLRGVGEDPMMGFLLPGLVKYFGGLVYLAPKETCSQYPGFLPLVFGLLTHADPTLRGLAAETLTLIGGSVPGKRLLEKHGGEMCAAIKNIVSMLNENATDQQIKGLNALENLFQLHVSDQTSDLLSLTQSWFNQISSAPMTLLMKMSELPYIEVRCAVLKVFVAIATQPWAQTVLNNHATFNEYLLDRSTESTKEGKEAKYMVIKTLVHSPSALEVYGRVYCVRLQEYLREGAYYVPVEVSVAMESES